MTKEEKAKRYDEALERARIWQNHLYDTNDRDYADELNYIFPELKESEDEQSKKWILEYLHDGLRKSDEQFKGQFKTAIAWLEKQGETLDPGKVIEWLKTKVYDDSAYGMAMIEQFKKDFGL